MKRVISYIDGFNIYYGLKSKGWNRYLWLDVQALSQHLLRPGQTLVHTKYFTARIGAPPDKVKRQNTYIEALQTLSDTSRSFGKYMTNPLKCRNCGHIHMAASEKMTDVNIAVELLQDAFQDSFDVAILISADSDLIAPLTAIRRLFPEKRIIVARPPNRFSVDLSRHANGYFQIDRIPISKSQFPIELRAGSGFILRRPESWK